jgi:hypothetical protein
MVHDGGRTPPRALKPVARAKLERNRQSAVCVRARYMSENTMACGNAKRPEGKFLSLDTDWKAEYWAKRFGVAKEVLEEAVQTVGPSVANVAAYLNEDAVADG